MGSAIDSISLIHWRKRLGNNLLEKILKQTIQVGLQTKTVKKSSFKRVISDTTVMEKNIAFPKDGDLYDTARKHLVSIAENSGIKLRQNYNKVSKIHLIKIDQFAHAKQFKKMKKEIKKLKTYLQRITRDNKRKWKGKENNFNEIMPLVEKSERPRLARGLLYVSSPKDCQETS